MQAERAPFVGIALAILFVAVETVGLIAYAAAPDPQTSASVGKAQTWDHGTYKRIKVRCRR
ncbi:MAG TPA: hypothetical protein VIV40_36245 [Kofleriaceae bacterium]